MKTPPPPYPAVTILLYHLVTIHNGIKTLSFSNLPLFPIRPQSRRGWVGSAEDRPRLPCIVRHTFRVHRIAQTPRMPRDYCQVRRDRLAEPRHNARRRTLFKIPIVSAAFGFFLP